MGKKHYFSKRLVWLLAFMVIVIVNSIGVYVLHTSYSYTMEKVENETSTESYLISQWVTESFNIPRIILQQLTSSTKPQELKYPAIDKENHKIKTSFVKELSQLSDMILFVGLFDKECIITHTSIGINLGRDLKHYDYCKEAFENPQKKLKTSNMSVSSTKQMNVTVTYPIIDNNDTMAGFGLIGLDLYFFQQWLDKLLQNKVNKDLAISVFDMNKMLLARVPFVENSIGKQLDNKILNKFTDSSDIKDMSLRAISPIDGVDRMWSFRKLENLPFVIVVGQPMSVVMKGWTKKLVYYIIGNILFSLLVIYIAYKFIQNRNLALKMEKFAITDKLTGIYNRNKLEIILNQELKRNQRYKHPVGLIILDVDYFKSVNDTYGHQMGDYVISSFAKLLKNNCRSVDVVGRWGGEEFIVICPDTDKEGVITVAESLREKIAEYNFNSVGKKTASFGVTIIKNGDEVDDFVKRADDALYEAKRLGRNMVCSNF